MVLKKSLLCDLDIWDSRCKKIGVGLSKCASQNLPFLGPLCRLVKKCTVHCMPICTSSLQDNASSWRRTGDTGDFTAVGEGLKSCTTVGSGSTPNCFSKCSKLHRELRGSK